MIIKMQLHSPHLQFHLGSILSFRLDSSLRWSYKEISVMKTVYFLFSNFIEISTALFLLLFFIFCLCTLWTIGYSEGPLQGIRSSSTPSRTKPFRKQERRYETWFIKYASFLWRYWSTELYSIPVFLDFFSSLLLSLVLQNWNLAADQVFRITGSSSESSL